MSPNQRNIAKQVVQTLDTDDGISENSYNMLLSYVIDTLGEDKAQIVSKYADATDNMFYIKHETAGEMLRELTTV